MMLFLRRSWSVLLLLLLAGCTAKPPTEPIQVAHLLPLTGPDKKAAEDAQHGMLLAVEDINATEQHISGRTIAVRTIDTHDDTDLVQAEAVRLVTLNKVVAFVAGPNSRGTEPLVRTAQTYNLPVVVPTDFPSGTGLNGYVSLTATPAARGEILARYAVKELKPKRLFVLTDQRSPIVVALAAAFVQEWPRTGAATLEEWPFRTDSEQLELISDLEKKAPAVALYAGTPANFLKLQGQLRDKKADVTLLYGGEDTGAGVFQLPGVEAVTATVFAADGLTEKGKEFAKRYEERFHEPPSFAAAQAYDAGRFLFETMQKAKGGGLGRLRDDQLRSELRDELLKVESFESVTGTITWKDRNPRRPVFVVRIKDGEAKVVQTVPAEDK
jgi:branched-chain amino acid transport system substrate-binding protein